MSESAPELRAPPAPRPASAPPPRRSGRTALIEQAVALVAADLAAAERRMAELLRSDIAVIPRVGGHLAFAGGKRLRPLLTLLAAEAAGYAEPERLTVAAVGELLHTATLLHDDVIDEGEFRRGRPAARMKFGNGVAVLTGDFCLARSVQAIAHTGHAVAVCSLADCVTRMAEGEVAQLHAAGCYDLDRAGYEQIIDRKTAALIAWCASVAGLVDEPYAQALQRYGHGIGHAFQIADDVLDLRLEPGVLGPSGKGHGVTGKDPGQDLREGKMTLPIILACEADPALGEEIRALLSAGPPMDEAAVARLLPRIVQTEAVPRALHVAQDHVERAVLALQELPPSPARDALTGAAHYMVHRSR